jgi:hypothetical protein
MMDDSPHTPGSIPFDEETWRQLPDFLGHLPEPVCLHVWGDETGSPGEREAARLVERLAAVDPARLSYRLWPRRANYRYYPVIGVMAGTADASTDPGLRIIGLPVGVQLTSLVAAVQAVAFRGQTLEPITRLQLHRLSLDVDVAIELLTSAEDEMGAAAAKAVFGAAAFAERVRAFLIMTDFFPEAARLYSAAFLPRVVINRRIHFDGAPDETELVRQIGLAATATSPPPPDRQAG